MPTSATVVEVDASALREHDPMANRQLLREARTLQRTLARHEVRWDT